MKKLHIKNILELKDKMQCPKEFICILNDFKSLCNVSNSKNPDLVICDEPYGDKCSFHKFALINAFCRCPIRVYLHKNGLFLTG